MTRAREAASSPIRRLLSPLALLLAIGGADAASAQDFDREVAFLTIPTGARLVGMGRAATAIAGEFQSVRWNPAVLSTVESLTPLVSLYEGPLEFRVNQFTIDSYHASFLKRCNGCSPWFIIDKRHFTEEFTITKSTYTERFFLSINRYINTTAFDKIRATSFITFFEDLFARLVY